MTCLMDGAILELTKKKTQSKEDIYYTMKFAPWKVSKYYTEVNPMTGIHLISAYIIDSFWKLRSFRKWDKAMDINPEDETSYTTKYQEVFLKTVENKYCAKHGQMSVIKCENVLGRNFLSTAKSSGCGQSSLVQCDVLANKEWRHLDDRIASVNCSSTVQLWFQVQFHPGTGQ